MSFRNVITAALAAPWPKRRLQPKSQQNANLPSGTDGGEGQEESLSQPLLWNDSSSMSSQQYGAIDITSPRSERPRSRRASPEVCRRESGLNRVPEEADAENEGDPEATFDPEWNLEERGLFSGSYWRVLAVYSLVPLTSLLMLLFLAFAPYLFWPSRDTKPAPRPRYYPSPVPEILLSSSLWSLAYLLRLPLYSAVSTVLGSFSPFLAAVLFNLIHAAIFNFLRITSLPILGIRQQMQYSKPSWHDPVFYRVWWLALGWAMIDVIVGITQSYSQISLYRDVMVPEDMLADILVSASGDGSGSNLLSSSEEALPLSPRRDVPVESASVNDNRKSSHPGAHTPKSIDEIIRLAVDKDLEQLVNLKEREDLEEIYGFPIIRIPVFVSCLQRVDSILLSTGNTLVLAAAYLLSELSLSNSDTNAIPRNNRPFYVALPLVLSMNVIMSLLHTPFILPRIGVHTTSYIGFLLGLGSFFAGLGLWSALA